MKGSGDVKHAQWLQPILCTKLPQVCQLTLGLMQ